MKSLEFVLKRLYPGKYFPLSMVYFEDLRRQYSMIDARGKVVVDVGADYGTTPMFWAIQGASKVIAFEADEGLRERMERFLGAQPWLEIRGEWKGELPAGDIIKFDCEGCERGVDANRLLETYSEVLIVHHEFDPAWRLSKSHQREVETEYLKR